MIAEGVMAAKDEYRIFVGGLSWNVSERELENAFSRYGKIIETQVTFVPFSPRFCVPPICLSVECQWWNGNVANTLKKSLNDSACVR